MPPSSIFNTKRIALRREPTSEKGSSPWGEIATFTSSRLGGSHDHGYFRLRRFRPDVLRNRENQAVDQVWRQIKVFAADLLLAALSGGADCDLAGGNVDRDVHWLREGRAFLYVVVADELEVAALSEHGGFIIDRAILESEEQARGDAIAADHLEEVTHRKRLALLRTQGEKAVNRSLHMPHGYGIG
jgi:hypothetical protein